jgi:SAM-dependent methyltransferase
MTKPTMDTAPEAQFDAYATGYDDEVNKSLAFLGGVKVDYFTRVKAGYLLDLLGAHFGATQGLNLLDVGCGVGNFHPLLSASVGSITGIDMSAASVAEAAARNPGVRYDSYDGARLPYADASFDAAMTVCVMHHVPPAQWPAFAAEMRRVVRPGGLVTVFEHNPVNPLTMRVVNNCEFDADAVLLRQREVRGLLAGAGCRNIASRAILSVPSAGPLSRKLDRALGRIGLGAQYYATGEA